jgi:hypothetical protein
MLATEKRIDCFKKVAEDILWYTNNPETATVTASLLVENNQNHHYAVI